MLKFQEKIFTTIKAYPGEVGSRIDRYFSNFQQKGITFQNTTVFTRLSLNAITILVSRQKA